MPAVPGSNQPPTTQTSSSKDAKLPVVQTLDASKTNGDGVTTRMYSIYDKGPDPEKILAKSFRNI